MIGDEFIDSQDFRDGIHTILKSCDIFFGALCEEPERKVKAFQFVDGLV